MAIDGASTAWVLVSTALVFIMIPGVAYFYAGEIRRKSVLTILVSSGLAIAVVSFQYFFWGYSLSFSETSTSRFIGNLDFFALINTGNNVHPLAPLIPSNCFMIFQCFFAAITPVLAFGSVAERVTLLHYVVFLFVWSTIVYDVVAYWEWAINGWGHVLGVLDFAGGTPVHITSGFSALAYSISVGPRRTLDFHKDRSVNSYDIYLGTALLWFGWFGFNGGSEFAINARAVNAVVVTNLAAAFGGITWVGIDMLRTRSFRIPMNGFCNGAVAGLVAITPASGYVMPYYSILFGVITVPFCILASYIKKLTQHRIDDACDVFAVHGIGGVVGGILTGIFAQNEVILLGGDTPIPGGAGVVDGHWQQVPIQMAMCAAGAGWAFFITFLILQALGLFFRLRITPLEEELGNDWTVVGEAAYGHDIREVENSTIREVRFTWSRDNNLRILWDIFTGESPQNYYERQHKSIKQIVDHIVEVNEKDANENPPPFAGGFGAAVGHSIAEVGADIRALRRALSNRDLRSFAGFDGPNGGTYYPSDQLPELPEGNGDFHGNHGFHGFNSIGHGGGGGLGAFSNGAFDGAFDGAFGATGNFQNLNSNKNVYL